MSLSMLLASFLLSNPLILLASYVSVNNSFPQPLSEEEESYNLALLENGDGNAKNKLVEHNLRLVAHIAKKYNATGCSPDDLISIGTIGLIKAVSTFDRKKEVRLATYAAKCIENEILMFLRMSKKSKAEISLNDPIGIDKDGNEINFNDILGTGTDDIIEGLDTKIKISMLKKAIKELLSEREQIVIITRFGLDGGHCRTQREVAKSLSISRSYVSRIEKKAIAKLKEAFTDYCS
jgi:RNA polymerase sporulation-specific sigma factor